MTEPENAPADTADTLPGTPSQAPSEECLRCLDFADVCPVCDDGKWIVETMSGSFYLLDLDAATLTRTPDPEAVEGTDAPVVEALAPGEAMDTPRLRRDHDEVPIIDLLPVREGAYMKVLLDVVGDGQTATWRTTNIVVSVRRGD